MKERFFTFVIAIAFGFALSRIGFSSWDEVHAMFTFADLRMFLAFCTAVVVLGISWPLLTRALPSRSLFRTRELHRGTIAGGLLFGMGWALCGACPSIAAVQVGEGQLAALWTLGGIVAGNFLYGAVHARYLRWDTRSCTDD